MAIIVLDPKKSPAELLGLSDKPLLYGPSGEIVSGHQFRWTEELWFDYKETPPWEPIGGDATWNRGGDP